MFALWTWTGRRPGPAPRGQGEPDRIALAIPSDTGDIAVTQVECMLVEPDHLTVARRTSSVRAWRAALDEAADASTLPPAAHAVPNATGTGIISADRAMRALTGTMAVGAELDTMLRARLRPYQARGIAWLRETVDVHGGAVLADEMGLGKTVQAIGFLLGHDGPQLVLCPTSLVSNWVHEIERFAPSLRPVAWRGGELPSDASDLVVIAGYPTLRGHAGPLGERSWATVIFDEAQVLKNPRTQVAKAARAVTAQARIALTGTPVENHLDELWALLNLVVPRSFTHKAQFRRRFVRPIHEGSADAALRLRDTLEPIVLTRKKSQVAAALPPKIHCDLICDLTDEQGRLYDELLDRAEDEGFGSGVQRHSRVLAVLTALGQVCNHPGLISGDLDELSGRSGKFDICADILANNVELGDPTLVFTRFRRTGELLVRHCAEQLGVTAPFFHGGLSIDERTRIVTRFQSADGPPVLILSLRAAGTGLTLTRAADVIHYDRWWNPAVEAQASDRAHRIGQTRTVTVTTLTTGTTVEEHIAAMHDRKSALADLTSDTDAGTGAVAALARLDDDHLLTLLRRKRGN
ncbi:DEAD/DEAH box helicase [Nocardia macrotermitis]|uniref:RNA polymerase-associated protein RapA n=1 Tax=Nocardia macrotermitis TaxID=2585198 RepID=A0A7K0CW21_9NOCA|nr:DEAD/DEAH box helicase [Nocardia macrotermitis]MQY17591.1 RNA polymerase-associated protein RapA [Nocardia macrotermitis]